MNNTPYLIHKTGKWAIPWNAPNAGHQDMRPCTVEMFEILQSGANPFERPAAPAKPVGTPAPELNANAELSAGVTEDHQ